MYLHQEGPNCTTLTPKAGGKVSASKIWSIYTPLPSERDPLPADNTVGTTRGHDRQSEVTHSPLSGSLCFGLFLGLALVSLFWALSRASSLGFSSRFLSLSTYLYRSLSKSPALVG